MEAFCFRSLLPKCEGELSGKEVEIQGRVGHHLATWSLRRFSRRGGHWGQIRFFVTTAIESFSSGSWHFKRLSREDIEEKFHFLEFLHQIGMCASARLVPVRHWRF